MSEWPPVYVARVPASQGVTKEDLHLLKLGVRQDLPRKLDLGSSFGLCFSYMSTTTGILGEQAKPSCPVFDRPAVKVASIEDLHHTLFQLVQLDIRRYFVIRLQLWWPWMHYVWLATGVLFHFLCRTGAVRDSIGSSLCRRVSSCSPSYSTKASQILQGSESLCQTLSIPVCPRCYHV